MQETLFPLRFSGKAWWDARVVGSNGFVGGGFSTFSQPHGWCLLSLPICAFLIHLSHDLHHHLLHGFSHLFIALDNLIFYLLDTLLHFCHLLYHLKSQLFYILFYIPNFVV